LQHRSPQEAIKPLEKAGLALAKAEKIWICLLVAHHRCGNHSRVKELLAIMRQSGFDEEELNKIERDLNEPPPYRIDAVRQLIAKQDVVGAEIAARLLVQDFPDHASAKRLLQEKMAQTLKGMQVRKNQSGHYSIWGFILITARIIL